MSDLFMTAPKSSAVISECGSYRYRLERVWEAEKERVAFIMLNPSTADASQDDPTIRRCIGFAKAWGFGGLIVGNLFALRSTDPKALYGHNDPVGPENDEYLRRIAQRAETVVCAWGTHGALNGRGVHVANLLDNYNLAALKLTASGHPGHPLYVASSTEPKAYFAPAPSTN